MFYFPVPISEESDFEVSTLLFLVYENQPVLPGSLEHLFYFVERNVA
jgi:hypothetical protein